MHFAHFCPNFLNVTIYFVILDFNFCSFNIVIGLSNTLDVQKLRPWKLPLQGEIIESVSQVVF